MTAPLAGPVFSWAPQLTAPAQVVGSGLLGYGIGDKVISFTDADYRENYNLSEFTETVALGYFGYKLFDYQLGIETQNGSSWARNRAAHDIRSFRTDMRAAGMSTERINSYVRAFELPTFRYGHNLNPFKTYYRHFSLGDRIGGPWVHSDTSLLNVSPLTRRIWLALPESNTATATSSTHIPFFRLRAVGNVAPQPSSFTGLDPSLQTGGRIQYFVPNKPYLDFNPMKSWRSYEVIE